MINSKILSKIFQSSIVTATKMYLNSLLYLSIVYLVILCNGASLPQDVEEKIVGGVNANEGQAPYQVSLRKIPNYHFCGGSIINSKTVVTAAHCVVSQEAKYVMVVVGTNSLHSGGVRYAVSRLTHHEKYDPNDITNDIAIVIVKTPFEFNDLIKPISLPEGYTDGGVWLTLTGWGTTSFPGSAPDLLQIIQLRSLSYDQCFSTLEDSIHRSQICTLTHKGEGACHGDSGGPLAFENQLVGIVSWGHPCAQGYPDVFTRVSAFLDWIKENQAVDE